jgi:hypothetical protein
MNCALFSGKTGGEIYASRLFPLVQSRLNYWHKTQVSVTAITLGLLTLGFVNPVLAQERGQTPVLPPRTITVTGRGVETIPTTLTQVRLGVEVQGKTAQEVQQQAARRSSAVVELLRSRQVEKLETTGISLNPVYSYNNNMQRLTGYTATNTLSFRLPNQQAGTVIDAAVKAGATRIDGISFVASDQAIATAQQQALKAATQDAQQQASAVLSVLNLSPKEVVGIQVNGANPPQPPMPLMVRESALANKADSTPVVGGEQEVEASVMLQISY